jgi:hypothetical protein
MSEARAVAPWLAAVVALWAAGLAVQRWRAGAGGDERPSWQRSFLELSEADQRLYRELREGILEAENSRSATGTWPEPAELAAQGVPPFSPGPLGPALEWSKREQGVYVNYLGVPRDGAGLRWLVLFIEPEKNLLRAAGEPAPPVDEEHHTLPSGLALHVTVWTADQVPPNGVLAFPVAEGWTQLIGR